MMTKKDREIANQKAMISNRDKLIEYQTKRVAKLEATLKQISVLASSNNYGNPGAYLRKIKELVRPLNQY